MGKIRCNPDSGNLFIDFRHVGRRCREYTALPDIPTNRKKLEKILERIELEIKLGGFDYAKAFPGSKNIAKSATSAPAKPNSIAVSVAQAVTGVAPGTVLPTFNAFADIWVAENEVAWRRSHRRTVMDILNGHLRPVFGDKGVGC